VDVKAESMLRRIRSWGLPCLYGRRDFDSSSESDDSDHDNRFEVDEDRLFKQLDGGYCIVALWSVNIVINTEFDILNINYFNKHEE